MVDNGLTPHIVADATFAGLVVPEEHVTDGKIILNVSHAATRGLSLGNDSIEFEARFAGRSRHLSVPVAAVLGIYARETGQGMIFSDEEPEPPPEGPDGPDGPGGSDDSSARPKLKVVK